MLLIGAAVVIAAAALIGIFLSTPEPQSFSGFAMGSVLTQSYWGAGNDEAVLGAMLMLERELVAATEPPALAREIFQASGGTFNPYLGALTKLWNIDGDTPYVPTQIEINEALQKRELDLGAYGKGAACDRAQDVLISLGVKSSIINLGGNILTHGCKPWGKPFKIALRDPKGGPNDTLGIFTLRGTNFISTSGSYEKYFEQDGKRYHHIFDPETGYPAERDPGLISVTVITTGEHGGAIGDAISTACFVLGHENSLDLLAKYRAAAIFIYEDGTVKYIGEVEDYFKLEQ